MPDRVATTGLILLTVTDSNYSDFSLADELCLCVLDYGFANVNAKGQRNVFEVDLISRGTPEVESGSVRGDGFVAGVSK